MLIDFSVQNVYNAV